MKRLIRDLVVSFLLLGASAASCREVPLKRHWRETDSETLWTVRYTNCDYSFYVLLGKGVVAHGTHSPSPNHGFLIALGDVGTTSYVSWEKLDRWMDVDASYDVGDPPEAEQFSRGALLRPKRGTVTSWGGLKALRIHAVSGDGKTIDEGLTAVRSGIVYRMGMHTTPSAYAVDEVRFQTLVTGFNLLPLPHGECSNG